MRLLLIGPPGAGKGTQSLYIAEKFGIPVIATGDIFRDHVAKQTSLGNLARAHLDAGDLVPDHITCDMVAERLAQADAQRGFLLDGFPRTVPHAEKLDEILADRRQAGHLRPNGFRVSGRSQTRSGLIGCSR